MLLRLEQNLVANDFEFSETVFAEHFYFFVSFNN